jgi:hypothetical protein
VVAHAIGLSNEGTGQLDAHITVGGSYTLGITDLLEQYFGMADELPGLLGYPSLNGGTVNNADSQFFLTLSITATPEPASLALLGGGVAFLGMLRGLRHNRFLGGLTRHG